MKAAPTTDRGRASKSRIVQAAADLFYRGGVAATGLADVTAASGTGKGQLYHFFNDKPDLVLAVIEARSEAALSTERPHLGAINDEAGLRAWVDHLIAVHSSSPVFRCPLGSLVAELSDNEAARDLLDNGLRRWQEEIADAITRVKVTGGAPQHTDSMDEAEVLLCAYEGGILLSAARHSVRPLKLSLTAAVDRILDAAPNST